MTPTTPRRKRVLGSNVVYRTDSMMAVLVAAGLRRWDNRWLCLPWLQRAACLVVAGLLLSQAQDGFSNPVGGNVVVGKATVTSTGSTVQVDQQTKIIIIDWSKFNIAKGETTQFLQPGTNALAVNRIGGNDPSQILGNLLANGRIILINGNGILFGPNAKVDVGALIATTSNASNEDIASGKATFDKAGNPNAMVVNQGTINAKTGMVGLVAPAVRNDGVIMARLSNVTLGASNIFTIDFTGDGLISFPLDANVVSKALDANGKPVEALVVNNGRIEGATVLLTARAAKDLVRNVVSMGGIVTANKVTQQGGKVVLGTDDGTANPQVTLDGNGGGVAVTGTVTATGGTIVLTGNAVTLAGATLNTSSATAGGSIRIGGDNTAAVTVDQASLLAASAVSIGNGGNIYVMSNDTHFAGRAEAKGGAAGGNGGSVETSGHVLDIANASIDTSAVSGRAGNWLLDPDDYTIDAAQASTIQTNLVNGDVTIQTTLAGSGGNGDIFVNAPINWSNGNSLTLSAYRNIAVNANIANTGGAAVTLYADNNGTGTGTVRFASGTSVSTSGVVSIFYNPSVNPAGSVVNTTSYVSPNENFALNVTGGGTLTAYMLVNTVYDLQNIQNNLSGTYALGRDIDASETAAWNGGAGFNPIGILPSDVALDTTGAFIGMFDGEGHTISNLMINRPTTDIVGLFSSNFGMIRNIGLIDANVGGHVGVGTLVAVNGGLIEGSFATGTVTAIGFAGGLVGFNGGNAIIDDSVVPFFAGVITQSYANVNVTTDDREWWGGWSGGLVGYNNSTGTITHSYSTGTVSGGIYASFSLGGFVGSNIGTISHSYATGAVVNGSGFAGDNSGTITQAYATGRVIEAGGVGASENGFAGSNSGTVTKSYWDVETTGQSVGIGGDYTDGVSGLTSAQARIQSSYAGWDFAGTWFMIDGETRPFLRSEYSTTITNAHQLQLMAMNLSTTYTLANDIDLGPALAADANGNYAGMWGAHGFVPIGGAVSPVGSTPDENTGAQFSGVFDGQHHTISNLTINLPALQNVGLFGFVEATGVVRNIGLLAGSVTGRFNTGELVGFNNGTISQSYATGAVSGVNAVGGLVGHTEDGAITQSYATGAVIGTIAVGGLVGNNWIGLITDSYATGTVFATGDFINNDGYAFAGGLVGGNGGPITNSYATGAVSGTGNGVGGLVGGNWNNGPITQSYATGTVSGFDSVGGLVGVNWNTEPITQSYATGAVSGGNQVGGLVGANYSPIVQSYATGGVSGSGYNVGGLVGENESGSTITNSFATGAVNSYAAGELNGSGNHVGGLVGFNTGTITQSYATGTVDGVGVDWTSAGGLVGGNGGTITESYATGAVRGRAAVGGLVGENDSSGTITRSHATGTVSGTYGAVGGLVGWDGGTIIQSYATGSVQSTGGGGAVGGLVGTSAFGSTITASYATGAVNGDGNSVGGLAGWNGGAITDSYATGNVSSSSWGYGGLVGANGGTITRSYWDSETTGQANGVGNGDASGVTGLTSAQARTQSSYAGWDFAGTWFMIDGETRPFLRSEYSTTITNAHQLQLMAMELSATYTLANDIDFSLALAADANGNYAGMWGASGFVPVGNSATQFTGTFDGEGHAISNLVIHRTDYVGLFGTVGASGNVSAVGLIGGEVSGRSYVGDLAGYNYGTISSASSTGSVNGSQYFGGLVGYNSGIISNSNASGEVWANSLNSVSYVGGLVGYNNAGTITGSYATGAVDVLGSPPNSQTTAVSNVGGLVGYNNSGTISQSYATGDVTARIGTYSSQPNDNISYVAYIGGLVGYNAGGRGTITQDYATGAVNAYDASNPTVNGTGVVGGLVGRSDGTISFSHATGAVTSNLERIGGLVGRNVGTITQSYATGDVSDPGSRGSIGGLVGVNRGAITQSYATGTASGNGAQIGGLVGYNGVVEGVNNAGMISQSYATGNVISTNNSVGGLVGYNTGGAITDSYASGAVSGVDFVGGLIGTNTLYSVTSTTFSTVTRSSATGPVSGSNYVGGLVGQNTEGSTITLSNANSTVSGTGDAGGLVGVNSGTVTQSYATGVVNGANKVGGLIGASTGTVISSYATGTVNGTGNVGGLVGENNGTITQSYATGTISGSDFVGGLVGGSNGTIMQSYATGVVHGGGNTGGLVGVLGGGGAITDSYATGAVNGTSAVGGLVGWIARFVGDASITKSYATGAVSGSNAVGGLVGAGNGTITQSYASGAVSGSYSVGGLVGSNNNDIAQSYWDVQTSTLSNAVGSGEAAGMTGLTTAQLKNGTLPTDFDLTAWGAKAGSYPCLLWQSGCTAVVSTTTAVTYWVDDATSTYGALANVHTILTGVSAGDTANVSPVLTAYDAVNAGYSIVDSLNAGTYTVKVTSLTGSAAPNYTIAASGNHDGTLIVNPAPLIVAVNDASRIYGDANPALTANITGFVLGQNASVLTDLYLLTNATNQSNVGSYAITAAGVSGNYYIASSTDGTLSVTARPITVTANNQSRAYGDANPNLTYSVTTGVLVNDDTLNGALATSASLISNVGGYAITQGTVAASSNYAVTFQSGTLNVQQRPITVAADNLNRTYGDANPNLTYAVTSGNLVNGDTLSGALATSAVLTSGIGNYAVEQGTLAATSNYALSFQAGTLTIAPRPVSVTADSTNRLYGDSNQPLTYSVTAGSVVNGDTFSGYLTTIADVISNVGHYAIGQGTLGLSSNYALSFTPGTMAINPAPVMIAVENVSRAYGDANPALSATISGLKLGQDASVLSGLTYTTTATQTSNVGGYAITSSGGTAANYYIAGRSDGTLTVVARAITVTANNLSRVYGGANPALTYDVTNGNLVNGDRLTGALATSAVVTSNVGGYGITQGSLATTANYALTFNQGTLTVFARPITVAADNKSRVYGDVNPSLTYAITSGNLVNGDTFAGALSTSAVLTSNVGNYAIGKGTLTAGSNYSLNFQPGTLTITSRAITVTANGTSRVYGDANPSLTYTVSSGSLVNGDTLSGALGTSAVVTSAVGNYVIGQGSLAATQNYTLSFQSGTLAITPRPITVTANNTSRSYGDANPNLTYSITTGTLVNGDTLAGSLATSVVQASTVGNYAVGQGTLAASSNYTVAFQGGTLTITPAALTVSVNDASRMYGYANPDFTATITGFKNGDDASVVSGLVFLTDAARTSATGSYAIKSSGGAATNYVIVTRTDGTLTVEPLPITTTDQIATVVNYLNDLPAEKGGVVVLSSTDPNVISNFKKVTGADAANDNSVSCLIMGGPQCKK